MGGIDDLIAELCPEGVEFKALGDVGQFTRGNGLQKKNLITEGVGAIHYGQIYTHYGTATSVTKSFVSPTSARNLRRAKCGDLVVATTSENDEDVCRAVAWLGDQDIAISGDAYVYTHGLDPLYVAYFFQTDAFRSQKSRFITGTKVKRVSGTDLARIRIPVPALEVQRETVRVLTKMEKLEADLKMELQTELEARRRQYDFYRDQLFAFSDQGTRSVPMSEVGEFIRGRRFTKGDMATDGIGSIHYGEIYTHYGTSATHTLSRVRADLAPRLRFANPGDVVVAAVGETVEDVGKSVAWLGDGPVAVHDDCFIFRHSLNPKFVSYFFQTSALNAQKAKYVARAKVKRLSGHDLSKLTIPVPPREEQERIVLTLDELHALVDDLSSELSAELRARREQYEHYRDRLLTFEEARG